jgi:hypothetical protein ELI_2571
MTVRDRSRDYYFASLRKWFALPSGGLAQKCKGPFSLSLQNSSTYSAIRENAMRLKYRYLHGEEGVVKEDFLHLFQQADRLLELEFKNHEIDVNSYRLLFVEDIPSLIECRRKNARFFI